MDKKNLPLFPIRVTEYTNVFGSEQADRIADLVRSASLSKTIDEFPLDQSEELQFFFEKINQILLEQFPRINLINNMTWVNLIKPGTSIDYHDHINSPCSKSNFYLLTVIYYPKHLDNQGDLIIYNPMQLDKLLGNNNQYQYKIKSDSLVILPSWLPHKTQPNHSDTTRISIAMEYSFG